MVRRTPRSCSDVLRRYSSFILALPDRGYFGQVTPWTKTPLRAVWFTTFFSVLPGLLDLASPIAAQAIFALCAIALDSSYIIPIILCVSSLQRRGKPPDPRPWRDQKKAVQEPPRRPLQTRAILYG